jgi:hypothetical protein
VLNHTAAAAHVPKELVADVVEPTIRKEKGAADGMTNAAA